MAGGEPLPPLDAKKLPRKSGSEDQPGVEMDEKEAPLPGAVPAAPSADNSAEDKGAGDATDEKAGDKKAGVKSAEDEKHGGDGNADVELAVAPDEEEKKKKKAEKERRKAEKRAREEAEAKERKRVEDLVTLTVGNFDMETVIKGLTGEGEVEVEVGVGEADEKERRRIEKLKRKVQAKAQQIKDKEAYKSKSPTAARELNSIKKNREVKRGYTKANIKLDEGGARAAVQNIRRLLLAKPDPKIADRYRGEVAPKRTEADGSVGVYPCCKFDEKVELVQFGLGTKCYFLLYRYLIWPLVVALVLAIPLLFVCFQGDYFGNGSVTGSSTLGNLGLAKVNGTEAQLDLIVAEVGRDLGCYVMVIIDCVLILGISIYLYLFVDKVHKNDKKKGRGQADGVQKYSVWVRNVPPNIVSKRDYQRFFKVRGGPVDTVQFVMECDKLLPLMRAHGDVGVKLKEAAFTGNERAVQALLKEKKSLEKRIEKQVEYSKKNPKLVSVFVSFDTLFARTNCLKMFDIGNNKLLYPKKLLLNEEHRLDIVPAPEPHQVIFENLGVTPREQKLRRIAMVVFRIVYIVITLCVVFGIKTSTNNFKKELESCPDRTVTEAEAQADSNLMPCYCRELGAALISDSGTCDEYQTMQNGLYMAAFFIVLSNAVLVRLSDWIADFEKHWTWPERDTRLFKTLFWCLFVQTNLLIIMVENQIGYVKAALGSAPFFCGDFQEASPEWYVAAAQPIILIMLMEMWRPLYTLMLYPCLKCKRDRTQSCCCRRCYNIPSQYTLNEMWYGPRFEYVHHLAILVNTFFSALLYSAGMPALILFGIGSILLQRYSNRYAFLRYFKNPRKDKQHITVMAVEMLPWAIVFHSLMSMWLFTGPVFAPSDLPDAISFVTSLLEAISLEHFSNFQSFFFFAMAVAGAIYILYGQYRGACRDHREYFTLQLYETDPDRLAELKESIIENERAQRGAAFGSYDMTNQPETAKAFAEIEQWTLDRARKKKEEKKLKLKDEKAAVIDQFAAFRDEEKKDPKKKAIVAQRGETIVHMAPTGQIQYVEVTCRVCYEPFTIIDHGYEREYQCVHCEANNLF